jgi:hypothetical protein
VQVEVPEHAPPHPANVDPEPGAAVRMTTVPLAKSWVQFVGQRMALGELVTLPDPFPRMETVSL